MFPLLLLKGSLIGLSLSMPMGPTGMLCLRYSLLRGKKFGIASGVGIALAEASCGALTAIGLSTLTAFIESHQIFLQIIGSLFLFYFGLFTLKSERNGNCREVDQNGPLSVLFLMFLLTLTNPLTLLSFVAIFSAIGVESFENDFLSIILISSGVFLGSVGWWALVSSSSTYFASKIQHSSTHKIQKMVGFIILGLSIFSFLSAFRSYI